VPADPYGDAGTIFRIYNYRGQVTHRRRNPAIYGFVLGGEPTEPTAHFLVDPRYLASGPSERTAREDIGQMYAYVHDGCEAVLALLP
jgi:hypothetical protein